MSLLKYMNKAQLNSNKFFNLSTAILLLIGYCFISVSANAETTEGIPHLSKAEPLAQLKVTPKPCVALRKGQKCYLEVTFNWQHPKVSDYCLVNTTTKKTMKCWQQQAQGEFNFDFQSTLSNDFALRQPESTIDLAHTEIPVAWVYKSSKRAKSTWRLF